MKQKDLYDCIKKHSSELEIEDIILTHISKCCEGLVLSNNRKYNDWEQCILPYLKEKKKKLNK